jgi:Yip1 domain
MWKQLVIDSLVRPRSAARRVLALGFAPGQLLQAAAMVTCVGMLLGYLALRMSAGEVDAVSAAVLADPLLGAAAQLAVMAVVVVLTVRVGRLFGGSGGLWDALALVVWLNAMMVLIQAGQLVVLALMPPLAALLAIATLFWAIWAYANFVAELHGFRNPMLVLGAVVLTAIVLFFSTAMLLAILGITPQETS